MAVQRRLFDLPAKRRVYTGEAHQLARQRVVEQHQHGGGPLVPAAATTGQATIEAVVLAGLALHIGRHRPAQLGGVYAIRSVSPTITSIDLDLTEDGISLLAEAILPRTIPGGGETSGEDRLIGVPGLRFTALSRGRVRLYRLDGGGEIVLTRAGQRWRRACMDLAAQQPAGASACWLATERADAEYQDALTPWLIARWSSMLRRIALWRDADTVDFAAQLPEPEFLAGPYAELMASAGLGARRGITVACLARRGGLGRSTMLLEVAAAWARQGKRVLLADLDPQRSLENAVKGQALDGGTTPWAAGGGERILHRGDNDGELRLLTGLVGTSVEYQRRALEAAQAHADLILLDTAPIGAGPEVRFAAGFADVAITCVRIYGDLFGWTETVYSDRYWPIHQRRQRRTAMMNWLDDAYDVYVEIGMDAGPEPVAPTALLDDAVVQARTTGTPLADTLWDLHPHRDTDVEVLARPGDDGANWSGVEDADDGLTRVGPWIEAQREPFLTAVGTLGRELFGMEWDPAGWIEHQRAPLEGPEQPGIEAADDPEAPRPGDITHVYRSYEDETAIANVNTSLVRDGLDPSSAAGRVIAAVPIFDQELPPEALEHCARLASSFVYPVLDTGLSWSQVMGMMWDHGMPLTLTHPDHPAAREVTATADRLFERITR